MQAGEGRHPRGGQAFTSLALLIWLFQNSIKIANEKKEFLTLAIARELKHMAAIKSCSSSLSHPSPLAVTLGHYLSEHPGCYNYADGYMRAIKKNLLKTKTSLDYYIHTGLPRHLVLSLQPFCWCHSGSPLSTDGTIAPGCLLFLPC